MMMSLLGRAASSRAAGCQNTLHIVVRRGGARVMFAVFLLGGALRLDEIPAQATFVVVLRGYEFCGGPRCPSAPEFVEDGWRR